MRKNHVQNPNTVQLSIFSYSLCLASCYNRGFGAPFGDGGNSRNALASLRLCGLIENQDFETRMVRGVQHKYDRRVLFV